MIFGEMRWLIALWIVPLLAAIAVGAWRRRRSLLNRFVDPRLLGQLTRGVSQPRRTLKSTLALVSLIFIILGLSRPMWNPQPEPVRTLGRDVCFIVDVSRSMLAEDLAPNRLERTKMWIRDTLDVVRGDRVALIAFAGNAVVKCPLTHDYGFMRMAIDDLSTTSVSRGGTYIGDAIRTAMNEVLNLEQASYKDVILITDGEDHESFPVEAAAAAGEAGIRIIAIGLGDENQGARIPTLDAFGRRTYLTYDGEEVRTKLDAETLKQMAVASNRGVYLNVATGTVELDKVYEELIRQAEQQETGTEVVTRYDEMFQIFLACAFGLLLMEGLIRERSSKA